MTNAATKDPPENGPETPSGDDSGESRAAPGAPSDQPATRPRDDTREPSTTGAGAWREEHDFSGRVFAKRFELRKRLGKGGMATVYEAFDTVLHKHVAVKVLNPEHSASPGLDRRFLEEARAISQLEHDHIVEVIDIGETEDGLVFLVMELLKGEDLGQTLWEHGALRWERVVDIATQICKALTAAHSHGIIHRDIKPANCMRITYRGNSDYIKVLDFGIAKFTPSYYHHKRQLGAVDDGSDLPTDQNLGTPGYMAPELLGSAEFDPRVDIYGLGVLTYRLLTNKMPVSKSDGAGPGALLDRVPVSPRQIAPKLDIPRTLDKVILRAIAPDPADRFQSAQQYREALEQVKRRLTVPSRLGADPLDWGAGEAPAAAAADAAVTKPAESSGTLRTIALVVFALAAGALLSNVIFGSDRKTPDDPRRVPRPDVPVVVDATTGAAVADSVEPATNSEAAPPATSDASAGTTGGSANSRTTASDTTALEEVGPEAIPDSGSSGTGSATTSAGANPDTSPPDEKKTIPLRVPKKDFRREIARAKKAVGKCYRKHSGGFGNAKSLEVSFTIDAKSGRIKAVDVPSGGSFSAVDGCIRREVESLKIRFQRTRKDTTMRHTFKL